MPRIGAPRIGLHSHVDDPLAEAVAAGAGAAQFFLGDPQGWKAPTFPGEPSEVRAAFAAAGITTIRVEPDGATADEKLAMMARFMDLVREQRSTEDGSESAGGTHA